MGHNPYEDNPYSEYFHSYYNMGEAYQRPDYEQYGQPRPNQFEYPMRLAPEIRQIKLQVGMAFSYGLKAVLARPLIWILGSLVYVAIVQWPIVFVFPNFADIVASTYASHTMSFSSIWNTVAMLIILPIVFAVALIQLDGLPITVDSIRAKLNYPQALLTNFLMNVIIGGCFLVVVTLSGFSFAYISATSGLLATFVVSLLAFHFIVFIYLISMTLFSMMLLLAVDGHAFNFDAFKQSTYFGMQSFVSLLGFHLVGGFMLVLGTFLTCGLALVIVAPMLLHANTHIYRQATGGYYPEV